MENSRRHRHENSSVDSVSNNRKSHGDYPRVNRAAVPEPGKHSRSVNTNNEQPKQRKSNSRGNNLQNHPTSNITISEQLTHTQANYSATKNGSRYKSTYANGDQRISRQTAPDDNALRSNATNVIKNATNVPKEPDTNNSLVSSNVYKGSNIESSTVIIKRGKIPIRRCASIDVGELNRKKRSRRSHKKNKVDREALLSPSLPAHKDQQQKRSGSVGNRPNSLKLSQGSLAQNAFPTPVPQKRHSSGSVSDQSKRQNSNANIHGPDIELNETSAILAAKSKSKPRIPKVQKIGAVSKDVSVDLIDSDDSYTGSFPAGGGYRKHGLKCKYPSSPYHRIKPPVIHRLWIRVIGFILYALLAFLVFCPTLACVVVVFPVSFILKTSLGCCCDCCTRSQGENCMCCACGQRLSMIEKFWVRTGVYSPHTVQCLIIVEYGLSASQIINLINTRLVLVKGDDGRRLYPRFSQKVVRSCSEYIWYDDLEFFIHNHVFAMPKGIESLEDLQDYISDMASRPMHFGRPLWEVQVLSDFGEMRDTVLLFRMHPCVSDGISMVRIFYKSIADVDSVTTSPPHLSQENCLDYIRSIFYGPLIVLSKYAFKRPDFGLLHGNHIHLSGKKVITWSEPFSLSSAIRIKQVTRSTLSEVLMSVTAGSLRDYLIINGIPHPYDMQTSIPVHFGANPSTPDIGNHVIMLNVTLPTNTEGVIPRLWQMKDRMIALRKSLLFPLTRRVFSLTHSMLSESCWTRLWTRVLQRCSCIISSLPGPETTLRLSSKQIKTVFYWFPPVHKVAIAISFFTYGDQVQMAVSTDRDVMPNPELITKDFIMQMQSLYDQLAHRRIPGEHGVNKKVDMTMLNGEIRPEETAEELQKKMSMVHQELQNLKHKLEAMKPSAAESDHSHKARKKIENLKLQFRELLVELRKRKAAENEAAITISEEDSTEDDDDFDIPRRPFRRRAMSVSSRLSTVSVSSTIRPLAASATPAVTPDFSPDSPLIIDKQVPYTSYSRGRKSATITPYTNHHPPSNRRTMEEFEIIEYHYSPSLERRYKLKK